MDFSYQVRKQKPVISDDVVVINTVEREEEMFYVSAKWIKVVS